MLSEWQESENSVTNRRIPPSPLGWAGGLWEENTRNVSAAAGVTLHMRTLATDRWTLVA
jgi:hypothetical protein